MLDKTIDNFRRFAKGEPVSHLYEIYLLMFADLKKHLFSYQFLSSAVAVTNYTVKHWYKFDEIYPAQNKAQLTNAIREATQEKVFPQLLVLNSKLERVPF